MADSNFNSSINTGPDLDTAQTLAASSPSTNVDLMVHDFTALTLQSLDVESEIAIEDRVIFFI